MFVTSIIESSGPTAGQVKTPVMSLNHVQVYRCFKAQFLLSISHPMHILLCPLVYGPDPQLLPSYTYCSSFLAKVGRMKLAAWISAL